MVKALEGKKTLISAGILVLAAVLGFWFERLDFAQALIVIGFAGGLVGMGDKFERYGRIALQILEAERERQKRDALHGQLVEQAAAPAATDSIRARAAAMSTGAPANPVRGVPHE